MRLSTDQFRAGPALSYLEDKFFDPGPLGQEVQHGEAGVGPHGRHDHPVASARARPDVVGETGQVVDERFHPAFVQARHVDSDREGSDSRGTIAVAQRSNVCMLKGGGAKTGAAANQEVEQ